MLKITNKRFWSIVYLVRKILKIAFFLLIAMSISELYWHHDASNRLLTHEVNAIINRQIQIPENIVKTRDCDEFFKWQHSEAIYPFMHYQCPWGKHDKIRKLYIGNNWFAVPRKYLTGSSRHVLDGSTSVVMLYFCYPDLGEKRCKDKVSLYVEALDGKLTAAKLLKIQYSAFLHSDLSKDNYKIIATSYNKDLKRQEYRFDEYLGDKYDPYSSYIWTNDNPYDPKDFVVCPRKKGEKTSCKSVIIYKDLYIEYRFPLRLLSSHNEIREIIIKLFNKWSRDYDNTT